ncbi:hypothetical protein GCM10027059_17250 [Myceligenerans halotolerans]
MSLLFQPIALRELTIPNRAWLAPMCPDGGWATAGPTADPFRPRVVALMIAGDRV